MPLHIPKDLLKDAPLRFELRADLSDEMINTGIPSKQCSDGHHTFGELYEHRYMLWITLCMMAEKYTIVPVWRSKLHSDGTMYEDSFILGIYRTPGKQMSYHLHLKDWDKCSFAETYERAPEWDGHTPDDILKRLQYHLDDAL